VVRQPRQRGHPVRENGFADETHVATLAGATVFCELGKSGSQLLVFSSVLG